MSYSNGENMIVSVCMTSFNQARYIVDAIEGVLMQKTNFQYELLIGEDLSTKDNSLQIVNEFEKKYPEIIKVIYDGKNHGMVANEQRLMNIAKGKYIAFCEADDYWIDPLKLQKQVDVLEKNPQYSASACQSRVIYGENKANYQLYNSKDKINTIITLNDLLVGRVVFQTASFLFRSNNIKEVPPLPNKINGWDRAVFMLNAYRGNIYWFKDEMAIYRKNEDGISTWVTYNLMKRDLDMVNWFKTIDRKFPLNELKAHIYFAVMLNSVKLSVFDLFKSYCLCLYYIGRSHQVAVVQLKENAKACFIYRVPKIIRRVMRKLKFL